MNKDDIVRNGSFDTLQRDINVVVKEPPLDHLKPSFSRGIRHKSWVGALVTVLDEPLYDWTKQQLIVSLHVTSMPVVTEETIEMAIGSCDVHRQGGAPLIDLKSRLVGWLVRKKDD